jgi:hypothetical protein
MQLELHNLHTNGTNYGLLLTVVKVKEAKRLATQAGGHMV